MWAASHMFITSLPDPKIWHAPYLTCLDMLETQGGPTGPLEGPEGNIAHS